LLAKPISKVVKNVGNKVKPEITPDLNPSIKPNNPAKPNGPAKTKTNQPTTSEKPVSSSQPTAPGKPASGKPASSGKTASSGQSASPAAQGPGNAPISNTNRNLPVPYDPKFAAGQMRDSLIKSATIPGRGGVTPVGRAFQKHAGNPNRAGSFMGKVSGNASQNTKYGLEYVNSILSNPNSTFINRNTKAFGDVLDVRLPNGTGARWSADGITFIGFLERYSR